MRFTKFLLSEANKTISNVTDLYHVSPHIDLIRKNGLKTKSETGIETFGSVGTFDEDTISLTDSYELANRYASALKLVIEVAHGDKDIFDMNNIFATYKPNEYYFEEDSEPRKKIVSILSKEREYKTAIKLIDSLYDFFETKHWNTDEQFSEQENKLISMVLVLSLAHYTDKRFPWIIVKGDVQQAVEKFSKLNSENVGIVLCHIIDKRLDVPYLHGEKEVRIHPKQLKIFEIIK